MDVMVAGHTLFERCVRLDADNLFSAWPMILTDADTARAHQHTRAELASMGAVSQGLHNSAPQGAASAHLGWQMPREQIISSHMALLEEGRRMVAAGTAGKVQFVDHSRADGRKSVASPSPPLDSLTPVAVRELQPGITHTGRVLRGKVIVQPLAQAGLLTLLEDDAGDVTKLALYNALAPGGGGLSYAAYCRAAVRCLPERSRVAIIEPFFKIMAEGAYGVTRVDDPSELVIEYMPGGHDRASGRRR